MFRTTGVLANPGEVHEPAPITYQHISEPTPIQQVGVMLESLLECIKIWARGN